MSCAGTVQVTTSGNCATTTPALHLVLRLSALDLRPLPEAVPSARLHAKAVLMAWGLRGQAADAELVTSELVTNGVRYAIEDAAGGEPFPVRLRLSAQTDGCAIHGVVIEVWDSHPALPERAVSGQPSTATGGRGLVLVEALSSKWGCYPARGGGKVVWSVLTAAVNGQVPG
jgi:anti-sigma regulatory factor (Ser/Thr protein kinase)